MGWGRGEIRREGGYEGKEGKEGERRWGRGRWGWGRWGLWGRKKGGGRDREVKGGEGEEGEM